MYNVIRYKHEMTTPQFFLYEDILHSKMTEVHIALGILSLLIILLFMK